MLTLDTLNPLHPGSFIADLKAPAWRNLWFLTTGSTVWGDLIHPTLEAAQHAIRGSFHDRKVFMDLYGDGHCEAPFEHVRVSEFLSAIPLPWPDL